MIAAKKAKMLAEREARGKNKFVRKGDTDGFGNFSSPHGTGAKKRRVDDDEDESKDSKDGKKNDQGKQSSDEQTANSTTQQSEPGDDNEINLPETEIVRRLRLRREPIRLFGEDLINVFNRLRELELHAPLDVIKDRQRNDLMRAMNEIENENVNSQVGGRDKETKKKTKTSDQILEKLDEARIQVQKLPTGSDELDQKIIRLYLKSIFATWQNYLEVDRTRDMKWSADGKLASATFRQTEEYIKPLFKHLKKRDMPVELIPLLVEIVVALDKKEYQQANDAYLRMAIGKAAWPIGVTQVGIHSRTGREKIFSQQIAHVLNDETSRKYIQALKRMMTYMQMKWTTDPSKSFEPRAVVSQLYPAPAEIVLEYKEYV